MSHTMEKLHPPALPLEWSWAGMGQGVRSQAPDCKLSPCLGLLPHQLSTKALLLLFSWGGGRKPASRCLLEDLAPATGTLMATEVLGGGMNSQEEGVPPSSLRLSQAVTQLGKDGLGPMSA